MIVIKITDGLGNQMFQYAYARILQTQVPYKVFLDVSDINNLRNGREGNAALNDKRKYQLSNFLITLPIINIKELTKRYKEINYASKFLNYCKELCLLPTVYLSETECRGRKVKYRKYQNYYVEGYFFDRKYYENREDILRKEFSLKERLCIPKEIVRTLEDRNTVSLHVRRGDFLKVGRNISEGDYYQKALSYVKDKIEKPFLFIFSDDMKWVKNNMNFDMEHFFISGTGLSDCEELTLMSMCKNNIIANSTYSYWGAWLNGNRDKIVISPRGWRQKIIPDSWVLL